MKPLGFTFEIHQQRLNDHPKPLYATLFHPCLVPIYAGMPIANMSRKSVVEPLLSLPAIPDSRVWGQRNISSNTSLAPCLSREKRPGLWCSLASCKTSHQIAGFSKRSIVTSCHGSRGARLRNTSPQQFEDRF